MKPCRRKWTGFAVALLAAGCVWPHLSLGDNAMPFTRVEYMTYEMMGPPELLVIEHNGAARFESHTNIAESGMTAVGTFATTLTQSQILALETALANPPFDGLPDHWGQIASGERYKAIRVVAPSGAIEKRIATARPVAAPTQTLIGKMDQIINDVRAHPQRNLALRVSDPTVDTTGTLHATMSLANPGTVAIVCTNPVAMAGLSEAHLSLSAWPDRDISTVHSTDMVEANSVTVQAVNPRRAGSDVLLELPPGATASFRIAAALPVPRNVAYVVQVLYQNTASKRGGRDLIIIELYSPAEPIKTIR